MGTPTILRYSNVAEGDEIAVSWERDGLVPGQDDHGTILGTVTEKTDIGKELVVTDDDGDKHRIYTRRPGRPIRKTSADGENSGQLGRATRMRPREEHEALMEKLDR